MITQQQLIKKQNQSFQTKVMTILIVSILVLYGVIVFVPVFLKIDSTPVSTGYRFIYFLLSLVIINYYFVFKKTPINKNIGIVCFVLFWIVYSFRIVSDLSSDSLVFYEGLNATYFYLYAFPATLIPCLAIILGGNNYLNYKDIVKFLFLGYTVSCFLSLVYMGITYGFGTQIFSQRVSVESVAGKRSINPIQISLNGGYLITFSLLNIFFTNKNQFIYKLSPFSFFLGLLCLLVGASRGPMATTILIIVICFIYYLKNSKTTAKNLKKVIIAIVILLVSVGYIVSKVGVNNLQIVGRINDMNTIDHTEERAEFAEIGWHDFLENPLFGKNFLIIYEGEGGFVHNIFLESLHATGITGSIFFFTMFIVAFYKCYLVFRQKTVLVYIMAFFLITTVFSISSGSLYANPILWVSTVLMLLTNKKFILQNPL